MLLMKENGKIDPSLKELLKATYETCSFYEEDEEEESTYNSDIVYNKQKGL